MCKYPSAIPASFALQNYPLCKMEPVFASPVSVIPYLFKWRCFFILSMLVFLLLLRPCNPSQMSWDGCHGIGQLGSLSFLASLCWWHLSNKRRVCVCCMWDWKEDRSSHVECDYTVHIRSIFRFLLQISTLILFPLLDKMFSALQPPAWHDVMNPNI